MANIKCLQQFILLYTIYSTCVLPMEAVNINEQNKIVNNTTQVDEHYIDVDLARNKHDQNFKSQSTRADDLDDQPLNAADSPFGSLQATFLQPVVMGFVEQLAQGVLNDLAQNENNVTEPCFTHFSSYVEALIAREDWAMRMFDSMGKPPSGILELNLNWPGSWSECRDVTATVYQNKSTMTGPSHPFVGKYCTLNMGLNMSMAPAGFRIGGVNQLAVSIGVCYPNSCTNEDATRLVTSLKPFLPANITAFVSSVSTRCQDNTTELSQGAIAAIAFLGVLGALILAASVFDIYIQHFYNRSFDTKTNNPKTVSNGTYTYTNGSYVRDCVDKSQIVVSVENGKSPLPDEDISGSKPQMNEKSPLPDKPAMTGQRKYTPGLAGNLLLSFSAYTNGRKIISMDQQAGSLTCINGIRFLSMSWVILGHSYSFGAQALDNTVAYMPQVVSSFTYQAIVNATFSVDTFFLLSGLLVAYLSLREMKKVGSPRKFSWGLFYFHRFWRLTPPYMLVILVVAMLFPYWGSGPFWTGEGLGTCKYWWQNLLYINNFMDIGHMCVGWSWYLANDMQFYIISPLIMLPLFFTGLGGSVVCLLFIVGSMVATGFISYNNGFPANLIYANGNGVMEKMYMVPWCRIGPYIVGLFVGYLLYKNEGKLKIKLVYRILGWTMSIAGALAVLYGLYDSEGVEQLTTEVAALYNAVSRTAWAVCVAWVTIACASGYGGPVDALLSWRVLVPLSRLTYCAYLVHPIILFTYYQSRRTLQHGYDLAMVYDYVANFCLSYGAAFLTSLAFESPMMGLEKAVLKRGKRS